MSAADIVTCPGCGVTRTFEAVREALAVPPSPVVACYMLPTAIMPEGAGGLPPHLAAGGCSLVWLTVVDGRRVWAAEAEDIATIIDVRDSDPSKAPAVCPWLTTPACGRIVLEGRAKVPSDEARTLPTEARGMPVEWLPLDGDLWRFRIEADGSVVDAWNLMCSRWLGEWPCRFDVVSYEAPAELVDGDHVDGVRLVLNAAGEPAAFELRGFYGGRGEEAADASAAIERVFGPAVTLAPWSPAGSGEAVAEVLRWEPNR